MYHFVSFLWSQGFEDPSVLLPHVHPRQCFSLLHMLCGMDPAHSTRAASSQWMPMCPPTSPTTNRDGTERPWHAQVSPCTAVCFGWPYHRWPECHWCHLEGVSRCWVRWKRSWDTSEHQGQRSERVPRNGQVNGQQQETSCNLKCKHVWWMSPRVSKGGGNRISRSAASKPKVPGEIAFLTPVIFFFPSGMQRNEH